MGNDYCLLVSVLDEQNERIHKCAIKFNRQEPEIGARMMSPKNKEFLHDLLPLHVKNIGPIVDVNPIFEIEDVTK